MDIQVISNNCAKIILTKIEAEELNIDFDHFNKENPDTKAFLTYIIALLNDFKIIKSKQEKITVEVYEQENSDLIIYISASSDRKEPLKDFFNFAFVTDNPEDLISFTKTALLFLPQKIKDSDLLFFNGEYYLLFKSRITKENLISIFSTNNIYSAGAINIEKAKEYGKLLCHTPFKIINQLSSD